MFGNWQLATIIMMLSLSHIIGVSLLDGHQILITSSHLWRTGGARNARQTDPCKETANYYLVLNQTR